MAKKKGQAQVQLTGVQHKKTLGKQIKSRWQIYLLLVVPIVYLIIFAYVPMGGLVIAFKDYNFRDGVFGSPWVGFDNFIEFFEGRYFPIVIPNTIIIAIYSLVVTFPIPIIFALMLNAMRGRRYKKIIQTITYIPHFFSVIVMVGLLYQIINYRTGLYGALYSMITGHLPKDILATGSNFYHLYVWSAVWQSTGYNAIIYIAALAGVDQELHEAATIDGASRFQRVLYIDFPSILPTASIMLILAIGNVMNIGFDKAFAMQNSLNLNYSEIISTYVYKVGLASGITDFSLSTAIGMFNSVINFCLLVIANWGSKKLSGSGIF